MSSVEFRGLELRAHAVVSPFPLFCSRSPKNKHGEEEEVEKREKKEGKNSPSRSLASFFPLFSLALLFRPLNLPSLSLSRPSIAPISLNRDPHAWDIPSSSRQRER